jgi:phage terminase large subunit GpA-like protein
MDAADVRIAFEAAALLVIVRAVVPPPRRTVSEWADAERWLDRADTAVPGRWRTDREPWQRGIMDAIHEGAENIIIMKAGQVGVTECLLNTIGYHIAHDPCGMLLVEPSEALAKRLSRRRLAFMIRSTPALAKVVAAPRARDASQTLLQKIFPGGSLILAGANSPTALASDPLRIVLFDERDKYPEHLGAEGDPVSLGMKRTETFWDRRHLHVSTPTIRGASGIDAW